MSKNDAQSAFTSDGEDKAMQPLDGYNDTNDDDQNLPLLQTRYDNVFKTVKVYWWLEFTQTSEFCAPTYTVFSTINFLCMYRIGRAVVQPTDIIWMLVILAFLLNIAMLVMSILLVTRAIWKAALTELWLLVIWESSMLLIIIVNVTEASLNNKMPCPGNIGCLMVIIMQIVFTGTELLMMFIVTVNMIKLKSHESHPIRQTTYTDA
jgi:hypothetical protein